MIWACWSCSVGASLHGLWGVPPRGLHQEPAASDLRGQLGDLCGERWGHRSHQVCGESGFIFSLSVVNGKWTVFLLYVALFWSLQPLKAFLHTHKPHSPIHALLAMSFNHSHSDDSALVVASCPSILHHTAWTTTFRYVCVHDSMSASGFPSCCFLTPTGQRLWGQRTWQWMSKPFLAAATNVAFWRLPILHLRHEQNSLCWQVYGRHRRQGMNDHMCLWALLLSCESS